MQALISKLNPAIVLLCTINLFLHLRALTPLRALNARLRHSGDVVSICAALVGMALLWEPLTTRWMILAHLNAVLLAWDMLVLPLKLFRRARRMHAGLRRLTRHGLAFLLGALVGLYGMGNMTTVRRTDEVLTTEKAIGSVRAALITDAHLGGPVDAMKLIDVIDRARTDGADMLVLGGDIVDERTTPGQLDLMCRLLEKREFPMGIYYVFGNHDGALGGSLRVEDVEGMLSEAGVTVLADEAVRIDTHFVVAGRRPAGDADRFSAAEILRDADPGEDFILMIDHQPAELQACADAGCGLHVSGHTHNGQIWPMNWIARLLRVNEVEYGRETLGGMTAIVSSGVGGWKFTFRTAGHSEYVMITIYGASKN